jgi:hypothetical protein
LAVGVRHGLDIKRWGAEWRGLAVRERSVKVLFAWAVKVCIGTARHCLAGTGWPRSGSYGGHGSGRQV